LRAGRTGTGSSGRCSGWSSSGCLSARAFHRWLKQEKAAWHTAMDGDPLLPATLLPAGYAGREAWQRRCDVMAAAAAQMRAFASRQPAMRPHDRLSRSGDEKRMEEAP
jgi:hypothetical protein